MTTKLSRLGRSNENPSLPSLLTAFLALTSCSTLLISIICLIFTKELARYPIFSLLLSITTLFSTMILKSYLRTPEIHLSLCYLMFLVYKYFTILSISLTLLLVACSASLFAVVKVSGFRRFSCVTLRMQCLLLLIVSAVALFTPLFSSALRPSFITYSSFSSIFSNPSIFRIMSVALLSVLFLVTFISSFMTSTRHSSLKGILFHVTEAIILFSSFVLLFVGIALEERRTMNRITELLDTNESIDELISSLIHHKCSSEPTPSLCPFTVSKSSLSSLFEEATRNSRTTHYLFIYLLFLAGVFCYSLSTVLFSLRLEVDSFHVQSDF
ncbi:hypothetical protein BLNAU_4475 [Blattamonas nauphoetae]|uniref:NADH dehydrogenase subunit 6 n=1 Tax=Blattamonas nauphoetae TaxID=2049346 RepID=A0ABQ9YA15_9EUKA|nr:hypothetical protein BLNAU_4475 [Blattamonas nauphoetae]